MTQTTTETPVITGDSFAWISWLRVLAITGVVFIHTAGFNAGVADARYTAEGQLGIALDFSSRWAVAVFVMVSGAILLEPGRYKGAGDFMRRRTLRLVPALIFWHVVYLIYLINFTNQPMDLQRTFELILTGRLFTTLYFFWIILGLALITPILIPWIAAATRRGELLVAWGAALLPALTLVSVPIRTGGTAWEVDMGWIENPWAWWIPYLGYYLLGYALCGVVVRGFWLIFPIIGAVGGSALLAWQWEKTGDVNGWFDTDPTNTLAGWLEHYAPAESYHSPTLLIVAVSVFLLGRSLIRPAGVLSVLCRQAPSYLGRNLGNATLGVFALNPLMVELMLGLPLIGGAHAASSVGLLLWRCAFVLVACYLISLAAARIPYARRVF